MRWSANKFNDYYKYVLQCPILVSVSVLHGNDESSRQRMRYSHKPFLKVHLYIRGAGGKGDAHTFDQSELFTHHGATTAIRDVT